MEEKRKEIQFTKLEFAKVIVELMVDFYPFGIYNTKNTTGNETETLYFDEHLEIVGCYGYGYIEVFGLSEEEFKELKQCYDKWKNEDEEES